MLEPNNLRNRYRRYAAAQRAYGWRALTFREWATGWGHNPSCYSVNPWELEDPQAARLYYRGF